MREQPSGNPGIAFHRREIAVPVLAADGQPGDEMVKHEVVEDDYARSPLQSVDNPAVRFRMVADVKERDVSCDGRVLPRRTSSISTSLESAGSRSAE